jgi:septum site-determining protein MinC
MAELLFETKTETLSFIVLVIRNTSFAKLEEYFSTLGKKNHQYAVLDLSFIKTLESPAWFRNIRSGLKQYNISLVGVRAPQLNLEICKSLKIPVINKHQTKQPLIQTSSDEYISRPIRTGQQLFAQSGNLIVHGNVSSGAELAAIGDIYVFGSANGKFIAGAQGNSKARIYLLSGYPELLSINGITLHANSLSPITASCYFSINNGQLTQSNI